MGGPLTAGQPRSPDDCSAPFGGADISEWDVVQNWFAHRFYHLAVVWPAVGSQSPQAAVGSAVSTSLPFPGPPSPPGAEAGAGGSSAPLTSQRPNSLAWLPGPSKSQNSLLFRLHLCVLRRIPGTLDEPGGALCVLTSYISAPALFPSKMQQTCLKHLLCVNPLVRRWTQRGQAAHSSGESQVKQELTLESAVCSKCHIGR